MSDILDGQPDPSTSPIQYLRKLLGDDVVLVPIPKGRKSPIIVGWNKLSNACMTNPDHLAKLNHDGNIGVLLGKPSNGVCSIDIDSDADMDAFLKLNPCLQATLRSRRCRGGNLWVRIEGEYPPLVKITTKNNNAWGEWRADGGQTVIFGEAIDTKKGELVPTQYKIVHESHPVKITFKSIKWPDNVCAPILPSKTTKNEIQDDDVEQLKKRYGQPYYTDEHGNITSLNESFWAGLDAVENTGLYEPEENTHYGYNSKNGLYEVISEDVIKARISARILQASKQMNAFALEKRRTNNFLKNVENHLRGANEHRKAFSKSTHVHLANGIISFRDGDADLVPFSPEIISRNGSPIAFDEKATCPRFLNELLLPAVDSDDAILVQKYAGLCLYGINIIQRMIILDGQPGRGKTQLANVIQHLVGMTNVTQLRTEHLSERFELFRFLKKSLLVGVDVSANFLSTKGANILKGLVGGDWLDAEGKGLNSNFQIQGTFCVLITSNSRLRVKLEGDVGAWKRRLLIVRYELPPPAKKIPDFGAVLIRDEGSGILRWALTGLSMVMEDVKTIGDIALTEQQRSIVESLLAESESLRHFLTDQVEKSDNCDLTVNEIVEAYAEYCPAKGWHALPITVIYDKLNTLMLELFQTTQSHSLGRDGKHNQRGFRRVRFKNPEFKHD